jgi:hypothetical protein
VYKRLGFTFSEGGGVDEGDTFAIIVFENSTTTVTAGDTYRIWSDGSWDVPADGLTETFGTELSQVTTAANFSGTVVPEPSTFAAFAGLLALGFVMVRRRA